jgi:hypothetical protein
MTFKLAIGEEVSAEESSRRVADGWLLPTALRGAMNRSPWTFATNIEHRLKLNIHHFPKGFAN